MYQDAHLQLADNNKPFNPEIFRNAVKHIHKQKQFTDQMLKDRPIADLIGETNKMLNMGFSKGITTKIPADLQQKLQDDIFVFSGCKTYLQLKEVSMQLWDKQTGQVKSWPRFLTDVTKIHTTYNRNYLQAEYYYATGAAMMASKWHSFADGDRYNLQYRTAGDDRVRPSHALLNGVTLPKSDPFWQEYFPPNGWRCRCTVVEVLKDKYPQSTSSDAMTQGQKATAGKEEIFRFNPAFKEVLFPPTHPYRRVQDRIFDILKETRSTLNSSTAYIEESRRLYNNYGKEWTKAGFDENTGGYVVYHKEHTFAKGFGGEAEKYAGKILSELSYRTEFLSEKGKIEGVKYPDCKFINKTWEIKGNEAGTAGSIQNSIWDGKKADNVIFVFKNTINIETLREGWQRAEGRFREYNRISELPKVYYFNDKKELKLFK